MPVFTVLSTIPGYGGQEATSRLESIDGPSEILPFIQFRVFGQYLLVNELSVVKSGNFTLDRGQKLDIQIGTSTYRLEVDANDKFAVSRISGNEKLYGILKYIAY